MEDSAVASAPTCSRARFLAIPALVALLSLLPSRAPADQGAAPRGEAPRVSGDPLPSWKEGPSKAAAMNFVQRVTKEGSPDFVSPAERIAVFDYDGTLWAEQPLYSILRGDARNALA